MKNSSNSAETSYYIPPKSPIAIQPGDTGFTTVGKAYNRFIWTFNDWYKKKKKIIDPDKNWNLNAKPTPESELEAKQKDLFLK